ncbi:MAG: hypothetical protein Q9162_002405 [Coniocarpon cinnabarinum]
MPPHLTDVPAPLGAAHKKTWDRRTHLSHASDTPWGGIARPALIRFIFSSRRQPWSTYAVHLTTLTAWALPIELLLFGLLWQGTESWDPAPRLNAMLTLASWVFLTKWIKLLGHYIRYPIDIFFLPLSIAFGYLHGLLKLYAMFTLNVTTWGSRDNADDDDQVRLIRLPSYKSVPTLDDDENGRLLDAHDDTKDLRAEVSGPV